MSMTIQEAIKRITDHMEVHHIGEPPHIKIGSALLMAIAALMEKEERENPIPLTLEELRQMDGKPVYVVSASRTGSGWVIFDIHNDDGFGICDETWYFAKSYGKAWIAYRHKPKEVTK